MSFWKKFFKKEEVVEEVDFFKLPQWIIDNINILNEIDTYFVEINKIIKELEKNIEDLEKVDISEEKVEKRLKTLVKGNKPAFIKSLNYFLKKIDLPEKYDYKSIKHFSEKLNKEIKDFERKTHRNFLILRNLIGQELAEIAKNIKRLSEVNDLIKSKISSGEIESYEKLQSKLLEINNYILNKTERKNKFNDLIKKRKKLYEKEKELSYKLEDLKKGEEFKTLLNLKSKKEKLISKEYTIQSKINNFFSVIKRSLKKYNKDRNLKLIDSYLENPYESFIEDKELKISNHLNKLKELLKENKIDVKNSDKIMSYLDVLSKHKLKEDLHKLENIKKELIQINQQLNKNKFVKNENNYSEKILEINKELEKINEKIHNFKKRDITKDIKEIKLELNKLCNKKVVLKNVPMD